MGWFYFIWFLVVIYVFGRNKIKANWNGERVCVYCRKRMKFSHAAGHYAQVCSHCGRTQPRVNT